MTTQRTYMTLSKIALLLCSFACTPQSHAKDLHIETIKPYTNQETRAAKKPWTFIVYIAADNDLRGFAARNIKQMAQVGSNKNVNIVVQLDIKLSGNQKVTRRYQVEKNKIVHVNADDPYSQRMDSGSPQTLISCCTWALENYPAEHYCLIFWNHGTGIIDPGYSKVVNASSLFTFNAATNKLELDRSIGFLDFLDIVNEEQRGVCWDDTTGNYLSNQNMNSALTTIRTNLLGGKKFDIIGFDACLMSMLEVGNIMKHHADNMVSSQEAELGAGWNYNYALSGFNTGAPSPAAFAQQIVRAYQKAYANITNDYTQSAINLNRLTALEENVSHVATLFLQGLRTQKNRAVTNAIKACRNKHMCTHFDEPSYIDLHHFYTNVKNNIARFKLTNSDEEQKLQTALLKAVEEGMTLITSAVIENTAGKNLHRAKGISIYFPERRVHHSYRKTLFAASNQWSALLNYFLQS